MHNTLQQDVALEVDELLRRLEARRRFGKDHQACLEALQMVGAELAARTYRLGSMVREDEGPQSVQSIRGNRPFLVQ